MRLLTLLAVFCATPLCAATLTVTNLNDSGAGSLRDTVASAGAGDEIVFDASLAGGTISFGSAIQPPVALTITGLRDANGKPNVTLDGGDSVPFFFTTVNLTLNNLHLVDGRSADSSVQSLSSHLVVNNCVFESIVSGIGGSPVDLQGGKAWITDCTFVDNPNSGGSSRTGGISMTDGDLHVRRCTFVGNAGELAGAIAFLAAAGGHRALVVEGSTFTGNTATASFSPGGAISVIGVGGAVARSISAAVRHCTFSENSIVSATGGQCIGLWSFYSGNAVQLVANDCIFADSVAGTMFFASLSGGAGGYHSFGHNLCTDAPGWMNLPGDQVNTNPLLLPLADNGGLTRTHAINASSPAFNGGNPIAGLSADQRGRARGALPDIGAFELQAADIRVAEAATFVAHQGALPGTTAVAPGTTQARTFTLSNAPGAEQDLTITLPVIISGEVNCAAAVTTQPAATLAPGASSDLIIEATPAASGFFQYTVTVSSNDPDTPSFTFTVAGYAHASGGGGGGGNGDDGGCSTGTGLGLGVLFAPALLLCLARRRVAGHRSR